MVLPRRTRGRAGAVTPSFKSGMGVKFRSKEDLQLSIRSTGGGVAEQSGPHWNTGWWGMSYRSTGSQGSQTGGHACHAATYPKSTSSRTSTAENRGHLGFPRVNRVQGGLERP